MFPVVTKLRLPKTLNADEGAVTILFTVIVLMGIMGGLFALVVDGGQLMLERRIVQNAADASALYLGQNCALGLNCAINDPTIFAQNNSPDLNTAISEKCGSSPLAGCGPINGNSKDCQTTPSAAQLPTSGFVRVRSRTLTSTGGTALAPAFAGMFGAGNASDGSWTMKACSQAIWGKTVKAKVILPLAISACSYATPGASNKIIPQFTPASATCTGISSLDGLTLTGKDAGLSVVAIPNMDSTCDSGTIVNVGDSLNYVAPASMSTLCSGLLNRLKLAINQQVYLPVFSTSTLSGVTRKFQVISFVRIKLVSFKYGGVLYGSPTFTSTACANLCIVGQFTKGVVPLGNVSTSSSVPALGAMAVNLIP
jgi:Flp pilus assembly protein TadG